MPSFVRLFVTVIVLFACASCQNPGEIRPPQFARVSLGMTKPELLAAIGQPQSVSANHNYEVLRYYEDHGRWVHVFHEFVFVDGRLKLFGVADSPEFQQRMELIVRQR